MREVRMTFGEHLEELRLRIIHALLGLAVATTVCFIAGDQLIEFASGPHERAARAALNKQDFVALQRATDRLEPLMAREGRWEVLFAAEIRAQVAGRLKEVIDRLAVEVAASPPSAERQRQLEAWSRFAVDFSVSLEEIFSPDVRSPGEDGYAERFAELHVQVARLADDPRFRPTKLQQFLGLGLDAEPILRPLERFGKFLQERETAILESRPGLQELHRLIEESPGDILKEVTSIYRDLRTPVDDLEANVSPKLKALKYMEGFTTYFKVSLIFGIMLAFPFILYQVWRFVGAGLYKHEQRYILIFFPFSLGLFFLGAIFGVNWMIPYGLQFLASWGAEFLEMSFTLNSYVNLFFTLTILLGLVFQTPLVMLFLHQVNLVTASGFAAARKYTLLGAVVFSTMVTPPDPLSWSLMAGPIMLLYEIGLRICQVLETRARSREKAS